MISVCGAQAGSLLAKLPFTIRGDLPAAGQLRTERRVGHDAADADGSRGME